jgi:hypothetical protein
LKKVPETESDRRKGASNNGHRYRLLRFEQSGWDSEKTGSRKSWFHKSSGEPEQAFTFAGIRRSCADEADGDGDFRG